MSSGSKPPADADPPVLTEQQRAVRAAGLGALLGLVLRILGRRS